MKKSNQSLQLSFFILLIFLGGCLMSPEPSNKVIPTPSSTVLSPTPTKQPYASVTPMPWPTLPAIRTPEAREALPAEGVVEFHILHWNDFHGELGERITAEKVWVPGAARLAAFVKSEEAKYEPGQILMLDAGDWFEGSKFARESRGIKVVELYKRLGVDAATVGNHDFFLGVLQFYQVVSQADPIEIVSVNLRKKGPNQTCSDQRIVSPYKIFELGEEAGPKVRVAVIGAGAHYLEELSYSPIPGICFSDPVEEILKIYDQLMETEHPDVLILLTHEGLSLDKDMAAALNAAGKPVDIIIGGHSHSWIEKPEQVGDTIIVTAGELGRAVGVLDLVYNRATSKLNVKWRQEVFSFCSPEDPDTLAFLQDTVPASNPKQECTSIKNPDYDYLVDMPTIYESVGYWTLGKGVFPAADTGMVTNQVISSHGKEYPYGLFAHAPSELRYALDEKYTTFVTEISIKETACGDGATFVVSVDGNEIYRSDKMLPHHESIPLSLDVIAGKVLKLETISGDGMDCDWTIWGDPYLVKR